MRRMLPSLRGKRYARQGNRISPEPPRLVAKVCEEEGRGELWLGPLPTAQRMNRITETKCSIQIYCFRRNPTDVQVEWDGTGEAGMLIPNTVSFRCEMSNSRARLADMRALRPCLLNSLRQGDNAYVHCVSGISRAPMATAVMGAMLMGISFEDAKDSNVSFDEGEQSMEGAWIDTVLQESVTNAEVPTGFSCQASNPYAVVHATALVKGRTEPWASICRNLKGDIITVRSVEQASIQFKGRFCVDCKDLLRASLRLQIASFYG